jgi:hypothetical protein
MLGDREPATMRMNIRGLEFGIAEEIARSVSAS